MPLGLTHQFGSERSALKAACFVPGLPHLILEPHRQSLTSAMRTIGDALTDAGVERVVYYSTQWLSVLGVSFQARASLSGVHVDENWHEMGVLPFRFTVDTEFAAALAKEARDGGFSTSLIAYDGFPVDTGTIVADTLLNPNGRFLTNMVSCHVYADYAATWRLGASVRAAIEADGRPTALVGVSLLSARFFTTPIDWREDHVRDDDAWNQRILSLLSAGRHEEVAHLAGSYAQEARADMGFKAHAFLGGALGKAYAAAATCLAYGPLYGAGAAVLAL